MKAQSCNLGVSYLIVCKKGQGAFLEGMGAAEELYGKPKDWVH